MVIEKSSDKRLIQELFHKVKEHDDQNALKQIYDILFPRFNDFAAKIIKDDVISQDIVQDVFVKFWEGRSETMDINIEAYLFRMVRNKCLDYIRHVKVVQNFKLELTDLATYEELYRIDFIGDEPYVLIEKELQDEIKKTINELPDRCREVFILSRVKGLKNKEIAEKLQISIKNVERHVSRGVHVFREKFADKIPMSVIVLVIKEMTL